MIGLNLALTAAHNEWDKAQKKMYRIIKFYPGINGRILPFGVIDVKEIFVPENYKKTCSEEKSQDDYALLVLERSIGEQTGSFGLDIAHKDVLHHKEEFNLVGYPRQVGDSDYQKLIESGNHYQYGMKEQNFFDEFGINYNIQASPGQSGSGLYYYDEELDAYFVVGVHVLGRDEDEHCNTFETATWLTRDRFDQVQQWIEISRATNEVNYSYSERNFKQQDGEKWLQDIFTKYRNSQIEILNLRANQMNATHAILISRQAKWNSLREIDISKNMIRDQGAISISNTTGIVKPLFPEFYFTVQLTLPNSYVLMYSSLSGEISCSFREGLRISEPIEVFETTFMLFLLSGMLNSMEQ